MTASFALLLVVLAFFAIPHGVTFTLSLIPVSRTSSDNERNTTNSQLSAFCSVCYVTVPIADSSLPVVAGFNKVFLLLLVPVTIVCLVLLRPFRRKGPSLHLSNNSWGGESEAYGKQDDQNGLHSPVWFPHRDELLPPIRG